MTSLKELADMGISSRRITNSVVIFEYEFGFTPIRRNLFETPKEVRREEVATLTEKVNDEYIPYTLTTEEAVDLANDSIRNLKSQKPFVKGYKDHKLGEPKPWEKIFFPYWDAYASNDGTAVLLGAKGTIFEPLTLAHEFAHLEGHGSEIEAESVSYLALQHSPHQLLRQAANLSRLDAQLRSLGETPRPNGLREELVKALELPIKEEILAGIIEPWVALFYRLRSGVRASDYNNGFTDFLYTAGVEI